jgi:tRNA pseudouridine55 synthase
MEQLSGVLNINKEEGFTSHDVVAKLRGILKMRRIGHTGTLDPGATGVLVVCVGKATRIAQYLEGLKKAYVGELVLGVTTTTQDRDGEVMEKEPVTVTGSQLEAALEKFRGPILQLPPMYSAIHHQGKRLYELARKGQVVERKSREVTIHKLELLSFHKDRARLYIECSKGTYIRTLCADLGEHLGPGGHMGELVRVSSGHFTLEDAVTVAEVEKARDEGKLDELVIPMSKALCHLPKIIVGEEMARIVANGGRISVDGVGLVRIESGKGRLLALGKCQNGVCQPVRVFQ